MNHRELSPLELVRLFQRNPVDATQDGTVGLRAMEKFGRPVFERPAEPTRKTKRKSRSSG